MVINYNVQVSLNCVLFPQKEYRKYRDLSHFQSQNM